MFKRKRLKDAPTDTGAHPGTPRKPQPAPANPVPMLVTHARESDVGDWTDINFRLFRDTVSAQLALWGPEDGDYSEGRYDALRWVLVKIDEQGELCPSIVSSWNVSVPRYPASPLTDTNRRPGTVTTVDSGGTSRSSTRGRRTTGPNTREW